MKNSPFKFQAPILTKLSFVLNEEFFESGGTINSDISFENNFEVNVYRNEQYDKSKVELVCRIYPSDEAKAPFTVEAAIVSIFSWDEGLDSNTVNNLLQRNAPALLLGYLRPIIATVTNTPRTPAYHIPFMDFTKD